MEKKPNTASEVVKAIGSACGSVIGALALAVFFCGPEILPWYKKK